MHLVMAAVFFSELEPLPNGATLIVTVNVAVFAPPVLYFILREQLGRKGRAVQVLPQHRFKTFREWFLDIKDDSGPIRAGDSNPETFRETNDLALYVPPLTRTLLNSLGAGTSFAAVNASRRRAESEQGSPLKGRTKREFGAGAPATEGGDRHRKSVSFPLRPGDDDGGDDEESPAAPPKRLSPTRSRTAGGGPLIGRNRQSAQPALQRAHSSRERGASGPATAPAWGRRDRWGRPTRSVQTRPPRVTTTCPTLWNHRWASVSSGACTDLAPRRRARRRRRAPHRSRPRRPRLGAALRLVRRRLDRDHPGRCRARAEDVVLHGRRRGRGGAAGGARRAARAAGDGGGRCRATSATLARSRSSAPTAMRCTKGFAAPSRPTPPRRSFIDRRAPAPSAPGRRLRCRPTRTSKVYVRVRAPRRAP